MGFRGELGEVLGEREAEVIAASLRQHVVDRAGQVEEVVCLVDVGERVPAVGLGDARAADGCLPGRRHDE